MLKAKTIFGHLSSMGEPASEMDLINYVLLGLNSCYESFLSNINMREIKRFIDTLHNLLEGYECALNKQSNDVQDSLYLEKLARFNSKNVDSRGFKET